MPRNSSHQEPVWSIELRTAAKAIVIPTIRTVGADLAMRADFNLDLIDDMRMAVDEACAALVRLAGPDAELSCKFDVLVDRIKLVVEVEVELPVLLPTQSFGWRVLETLTDQVGMHFAPGVAGRPGKACIQLVKNAVPRIRKEHRLC